MKKTLSAIILFFLLPPFIFGCAKVRSTGGDELVGAPAGDVSPTPTMFPHPDGWDNPASHGSWVTQYGISPCFSCHKADSDKEEIPATCSSCHPLYPHAEDWARKELHGAEVLENGKENCSTQCHGYDLKGGLSGISCTGCHAIYPHDSTWINPDQHGPFAEKDGRRLCTSCHGNDLLGGESKVSCYQCHPIFPHTDGWERPEGHGKFVSDQGQAQCATQCHGTDLKGGISQVSCNDCHTIYPHDGSWSANHGATVLTLGKEACQTCHGADYRRFVGGKNCFSCHADYPHPDSSTWLPYTGGHGEKVQEDYAGDTTSCELCHGSDLTTTILEKNCFSCHASFPHIKASSSAWDSYEGHGDYTLGNTKEECQMCHGADYQGGSRGNPSCFACHPSFPHLDADWKAVADPTHGSYLLTTLGNDKSPCQLCHGTDFQGGHSGKSCFTCHADYPHLPAWIHGDNAKADGGHISECKKCHGTGLNEAPVGYQACTDCHESYVRHANADTGYVGWGTNGADRHGKNYILDSSARFLPNTAPYATTQARTSECRICHGDGDQAYKGGISGKSCMDTGGGCHTTDDNPPGPSPNDNWAMMSFTCGVCHSHGSLMPTNPTCLACHSDVTAGHHGWDGAASCRGGGCHNNIMP